MVQKIPFFFEHTFPFPENSKLHIPRTQPTPLIPLLYPSPLPFSISPSLRLPPPLSLPFPDSQTPRIPNPPTHLIFPPIFFTYLTPLYTQPHPSNSILDAVASRRGW